MTFIRSPIALRVSRSSLTSPLVKLLQTVIWIYDDILVSGVRLVMEWQYIIYLGIISGCSILLFGFKVWLKASIEKDLQANFDRKLEHLRSELRFAEEGFKSSLKLQEADRASLRSTILSGTSQRQSLVDKRRVEAVESTWAAVIAMQPLKGVYQTLSSFPFKLVAEKAVADPKIREFFKDLFGAGLTDPGVKALCSEQLFLTPLAWSYFSAYRHMIYNGYARATVITIGLEGASELMDFEPLKAALTAVLPQYKKTIEENEVGLLFFLFGELESRLLHELEAILEGRGVDEMRAEQVTQVLATFAALEQQETAVSKHLPVPSSIANIRFSHSGGPTVV